jgi:hypothetical protein
VKTSKYATTDQELIDLDDSGMLLWLIALPDTNTNIGEEVRFTLYTTNGYVEYDLATISFVVATVPQTRYCCVGIGTQIPIIVGSQCRVEMTQGHALGSFYITGVK